MSLSQILYFIALGLIVGGCITSLVILVRRPLSAFSRYLLLTLLIVEIVLLALHLIPWPEGADFARWLTNLDDERNLGTIFASVLWMLIALITFALGLRSRHKRWRVRYTMRVWFLALAVVFAFLAVDEFFAIHEEIDNWRVPYAIVGMVLVMVSALVFWYALRDQKAPFALLFIGLAVMGTSGILLEDLLYDMYCYTAPDGTPRCDSISSGTVYEEFFELVGVTIVVAALLMFAQAFIPPERWPGLKRLIVGGATLWGVCLALYLWPLPALEARLIAQPVHAEYLDGDLELLGYWLSQPTAAPGDSVLAVLYWRANAILPRNYNLSVHLLSRPSENEAVESVAQADRVNMGQIPSKVWPPGMVVRKFVWLTLPDNLPTPVSYQLMARVWSGPLGNWEETVALNVTNTDRPLMTPDSLLFGSLPVLSDTLLIAPSSVARYRFG
ncbi:MAG: hypothetical protein H7175_15805, partial [Burkholderiales bacterium]|nr:hypothetical protein [Anaerolineae bacterium]